MGRCGLLGLMAMLALSLAWWAVTPSRPRPADAPAASFSAVRAMADVRAIAAGPHAAGSAEDARVAAYLARRLAALGLAVGFQPVPLEEAARLKLAAQSRMPVRAGIAGSNVIGTLPGRDPAKPAVLLMAHHDTVWGSPGAADDSFGVAAILEILRALRAGPPPSAT